MIQKMSNKRDQLNEELYSNLFLDSKKWKKTRCHKPKGTEQRSILIDND